MTVMSDESRGMSSAAPYQQAIEHRRGTLSLVATALLAGVVLGASIALGNPSGGAVTVLSAAFVPVVFRRPEVGLMAFVAVANLLPFAVLPVRIVFSPTLVDFTLSTLLAAWLFRAIRRGGPVLVGPLGLLVIVYLGLALTSFLLGLGNFIAPERIRLFLKSINSTLLFFSALNCVVTRTQLRHATMALLCCGWIAAVIALIIQFMPQTNAVQVLTALGPLGYPTGPDMLRPIAGTEVLRAIGTSVDPNVLGGLMMMVSALLLGQLFAPHPLIGRGLLWPMLATTVAALLLTQSRSAMGGLVVAAVLLGTFKDRRLLLLLLGAAVALPFIPQASLLVARLQSGVAFQDRAAAMRLDEYANALNTIAAYPWFGIGFGDPPSINLYLGVSSIYLLIGQEMGLIGLSAFLAILGTLARQIVLGLRASGNQETHGILMSLAAALSAACAAGLLDHYYVNIVFPHMVGLFWLYVGLAAVTVRKAREG